MIRSVFTPIYHVTGNLAHPMGELSPQVTERALPMRVSADVFSMQKESNLILVCQSDR